MASAELVMWDAVDKMAQEILVKVCLCFVAIVNSPYTWLLQVQSCLVCIGLGLAWWYASWCRTKEFRRIQQAEEKGHSMAFINPEESKLSGASQEVLPKVTVILAVKGVGEQGLANWRSQLVTLYGGPIEFLFCVESKLDPAYAAVEALRKELVGSAEIRLVVAGLSSHCSQQIHNQLAGVKGAAEDSKYILFLDDDIQCHPGTIGSLVQTMETRKEVFLATGYSFDLPSQPSLAAYAAMAYRLPLLVGMSSGAQVFFVWGGCIFMRTEDLRANKHGMMTALGQSGYSNDLILTSVAGLNNRKVWSPPVAIFPGKMSGGWTMVRYWNYVRRQIFALLTYCSGYSYRVNRTGFVCYSYLSWACALPMTLSLVQIVCWLASVLWAVVAWIDDPAAAALTAVVGRSWFQWSLSHAASHIGLLASFANLACLAFLTGCGIRLFVAILGLCNKLSPEAPRLSVRKLSLFLALGGLFVNLFMLPVISMYTYFKPDITWARIRYVRRNGVVAKVTHPGEEEDIGMTETFLKPSGSLFAAKLAALSSQGRLMQYVASRLGLDKMFPVQFDLVSRTCSLQPGRKKVG